MSNIIQTFINGDFAYVTNRANLTSSCVDINIKAFSKKWNHFDISFFYRENSSDIWKDNANITFTDANKIVGNRIYNLTASEFGTDNLIRWKYISNSINMGNSVEIKIELLPRIRSFSHTENNCVISEVYDINNQFIKNSSTIDRCIGINNNNQYMCISDISFYILNYLGDTSAVYIYSSLANPIYAKQLLNNDYIVADYGNNRILQLDNALTLKYTYAINYPCFVDYNDTIDTCLITSTSGIIREVDLSNGNTIWQSTTTFDNLVSATYSKIDQSVIIASDSNRVIEINRTLGTENIIYGGFIKDTLIPFYSPTIAYKMINGKICITEQSHTLNFNNTEFNSSSSSTPSSLST